jgi:hypothetical protein
MTTSLDAVCKPKQNIELDADKTEVIVVVLFISTYGIRK